MAIRFSTALRNFLANGGSVKDAFLDGKLEIYPGIQPSTADSAAGQVPIVTLTRAGGTFTEGSASNQCIWAVNISSTDVPHAGDTITFKVANYDLANSVNQIYTVSSAVAAAGSVAAANILMGLEIVKMFEMAKKHTTPASKENRVQVTFLCDHYVTAGDLVIIFTSRFPGEPFALNTCTETLTHSTIAEAEVTTNQASIAAWVAANASNGLHYGSPSAGVIDKNSDIWSGVAVSAGGVAGWFRFCANQVDPDTTDTNTVYVRMDGSIGTSGADVIVGSTTIQGNSTITVDSAQFTIPTGS